MKAVLNTIDERGELKYKFVNVESDEEIIKLLGTQTPDIKFIEFMGHELTVLHTYKRCTKSGTLGRLIPDSGEPIFGDILITGDLAEESGIPDSLVLKDFYHFSSEVRYVAE